MAREQVAGLLAVQSAAKNRRTSSEARTMRASIPPRCVRRTPVFEDSRAAARQEHRETVEPSAATALSEARWPIAPDLGGARGPHHHSRHPLAPHRGPAQESS